MIIRRLTKHLKDQNWFAVLLDFFIVVVGVFIGIQVANWNETLTDNQEYSKSLERLSTEVETNLSILDTLDSDMELSLYKVEQAISALKSCTESKENQKAINLGLSEIRGTYGIHLRSNALKELTSNPRLLSLQSDLERKRFSDMMFYFDLTLNNAVWVEKYPLEGRFQNNPIIGIGELMVSSYGYYGVDFTSFKRKIFLKGTIDKACQNDPLIKSFFTWENWQNSVPTYTRQLRKELDKTKALLTGRLK